MNANLFTRMLQAEAANLYHQNLTPENFITRIKPMLEALEDEYRSETLSESDLENILVSSQPKKNKQTPNQYCFYDVVDLSMYRAN